MTERYVVLGLATSRSRWFTEVARWATSGALPVEFVKCIAPEEMRVRLASGRPFSALLVDAATGAVDRDLLDVAAAHGVVVLVVDGTLGTGWAELGVAAVLPPDLGRDQLLDVLVQRCRTIGGGADLETGPAAEGEGPADAGGHLVAVTGSGGCGASTVAMALAQGAAEGSWGSVVLADLRLRADQALLHDAGDVVPGVQDLVEAHRRRHPSAAEVQALTYDVVPRGYRLLLGLRRRRDWAALRPRSVDAAVTGLRRAFGLVVADVDDDLDGEAECGSVDVEERNVLARTAVARADVVVVVGAPGAVGLHHVVRTVGELAAHGVAPQRVLGVVNRSGRSPRGRAEVARAFAELTAEGPAGAPAVGPVHLPERRGLDEVVRDGARLPTALVRPVTRAVADLLARAPAPSPGAGAPTRIAPGSLGSWTEQEAAG